MAPKKVTLKDIAARCAVTPTIVSAVLNGRNGRITCSAEKRQLIQTTAKEMNYQANFFARSIKMKQIPIIGLMFHLNDSTGEDDHYINSCLHNMTFAFNKHQLEVLFIPYATEDEQLTRVKKLFASGLLGGVVTNIIPDSHSRICEFLASSSLPYMILGAPLAENIYCVYSKNTAGTQLFRQLAEKRNLDKVYHVLLINGEVKFVRYPFPDDYLWHARQLSPAEVMPDKDSALFVTDIPGMNMLNSINFKPAHLILSESPRLQPLIPQGTEAILFPDFTALNEVVSYVDSAMTGWVLHDRKPETYKKVFTTAQDGWTHIYADNQ